MRLKNKTQEEFVLPIYTTLPMRVLGIRQRYVICFPPHAVGSSVDFRS